MRNALFHGLFCLFFVMVSQENCHAQPTASWFLGSSSTPEQAYGLAALPSGHLLMAVNEEIDSLGGSDIGIWRMDSSGTLLQRSIIGSEWDDFARGLEPNINRNFLLTGMRAAFNPFRQLATMTMIDSSGKIIWQWVHPDTSSISELKIARCDANGNIMACGNISSPGQDLDPLLLTFDQEGNLLRTSQQLDTVNDLAHAPWPMPDGSWVIAGDRQMPDLTYRSFAMRISESDSLIWREIFDENLNSGSQNITQLSDGNLAIVGESYPVSGNFNFDISLRKISPSGQLLWSRLYGDSGPDAGFAVVEDPTDQSLTVTGYARNAAAGNTDAILLRLNQSGAEIARVYAGGSAVDYGNALIRAKEAGFWMAGFSNEGTDSQVLLAFHQWNTTSLNPSSGTKAVEILLPNPLTINTQTNVTFSYPVTGSMAISDIQGRILLQKNLFREQQSSFRSPDIPGIYYLILRMHEGSNSVRCIMVE